MSELYNKVTKSQTINENIQKSENYIQSVEDKKTSINSKYDLKNKGRRRILHVQDGIKHREGQGTRKRFYPRGTFKPSQKTLIRTIKKTDCPILRMKSKYQESKG